MALFSSVAYRNFLKSIPSEGNPPGFGTGLGVKIDLIIAVVGIALAAYLPYASL